MICLFNVSFLWNIYIYRFFPKLLLFLHSLSSTSPILSSQSYITHRIPDILSPSFQHFLNYVSNLIMTLMLTQQYFPSQYFRYFFPKPSQKSYSTTIHSSLYQFVSHINSLYLFHFTTACFSLTNIFSLKVNTSKHH